MLCLLPRLTWNSPKGGSGHLTLEVIYQRSTLHIKQKPKVFRCTFNCRQIHVKPKVQGPHKLTVYWKQHWCINYHPCLMTGDFDVNAGDDDDHVDLDLSDRLVRGDALRLQLNSGKWRRHHCCGAFIPALYYAWLCCFHTWPISCLTVVLSYLPYMLNSAAYILLSYLATCPLLYALLHSKALNAGTLHCMALQLQRQLLFCTTCTFHYMADQRRLHRGEGTSLRRWSLIPECQSSNSWWGWVWSWVFSNEYELGMS